MNESEKEERKTKTNQWKQRDKKGMNEQMNSHTIQYRKRGPDMTRWRKSPKKSYYSIKIQLEHRKSQRQRITLDSQQNTNQREQKRHVKSQSKENPITSSPIAYCPNLVSLSALSVWIYEAKFP
jgi:hypothetical protein